MEYFAGWKPFLPSASITQWFSVTWQVQFFQRASRLWATLIHILDKNIFILIHWEIRCFWLKNPSHRWHWNIKQLKMCFWLFLNTTTAHSHSTAGQLQRCFLSTHGGDSWEQILDLDHAIFQAVGAISLGWKNRLGAAMLVSQLQINCKSIL